MIYAVIDTNVLVSALWTHNPLAATKKILDLLFSKDIIPLYNDEVIAEYTDVLNRGKFSFDKTDVTNLISFICAIGIDSERNSFDEVMPDESDRVFYEISLSKEESFLVTGNLMHYPTKPHVVTPAELLDILSSEGNQI